jgi:hypothetical protein
MLDEIGTRMRLIRRIFADFLSCHYKKLKLEKIHSRKFVLKTKKSVKIGSIRVIRVPISSHEFVTILL